MRSARNRSISLVFASGCAQLSAGCGQISDIDGEAKLAQTRRESDGEDDEALPSLRELDRDDFPFRAQVTASSGGWRPSGIFVEAGTPVRVQVEASVTIASGGAPTRLAGEGYPEPYQAPRAVLVRIAGDQASIGRSADFFAPQAGELEFLYNQADGASPAAEVLWGRPTVEFAPSLQHLALTDAVEPVDRVSQWVQSGEAWQVLADMPIGARVWLSTTPYDDEGHAVRASQSVPRVALLPGEDSAKAAKQVGEVPAVAVRSAAAPSQTAAISGTQWLDAQGGKLEVRLTSAMGGGQEIAAHDVEVAVYAPLDTLVEFLPWSAFTEQRVRAVSAAGLGYLAVMRNVEVGDLIRVQVEAASPLALTADRRKSMVAGTLVRAPAANDGESGWLVPGGRREAFFVRIGQWQRELLGNDVFYAPTAGDLEIGRNDCAGSQDAEARMLCDQELLHHDVDVQITVGRPHRRTRD